MSVWDLGKATIILRKASCENKIVKDAKILRRLSQKYSKTNSAKLSKNLPTSFCVCLVLCSFVNLEIQANVFGVRSKCLGKSCLPCQCSSVRSRWLDIG